MRRTPWFLASAFVLALGMTCVGQADAQLVGLWEFEDGGNLSAATIGSDLVLTGTDAAVPGSGGPDTGAAALDSGDFYTVTNPIGANGGGARTNVFSLLMDIKVIGGVTGFSSLAEFDGDAGDGDYFLDEDGTVSRMGVSNQGYISTTEPMGEEWYRLVMSFENNVVRSTYLDGVLVGDHEVGDIDGRWTLDGTFDAFSDVGGGEELLTHVSNMALFDGALGADAVAALGGAGRPIPEPSSVVLAFLGMTGLMATRRRKSA